MSRKVLLALVLAVQAAFSSAGVTLDAVGCRGLFENGTAFCLISQPTLLSASSAESIQGSVSLVGSTATSSLQLDVAKPLMVLPGASLSISGITLSATSFQINPPDPLNDLNLIGISLQAGGSLTISNSTILLDCTTWETLFDTICDTGYAPGNCKVGVGGRIGAVPCSAWEYSSNSLHHA